MCGCHVVMPFSVVQLVLHAVHAQEHLLAAVCCSSLYWWDSTSLLAYHIRAVTMYLSQGT